MGARRLVTISLPPPLLKKAEELAKEENRTRSELVREALRFYVDTKDIRKGMARERLLGVLDRVQARTKAARPGEIRRIVSEAVEAARRRRRATA
jgi:metal-responsive CopG/Arc/MetJ family transcriptional regulator